MCVCVCVQGGQGCDCVSMCMCVCACVCECSDNTRNICRNSDKLGPNVDFLCASICAKDLGKSHTYRYTFSQIQGDSCTMDLHVLVKVKMDQNVSYSMPVICFIWLRFFVCVYLLITFLKLHIPQVEKHFIYEMLLSHVARF